MGPWQEQSKLKEAKADIAQTVFVQARLRFEGVAPKKALQMWLMLMTHAACFPGLDFPIAKHVHRFGPGFTARATADLHRSACWLSTNTPMRAWQLSPFEHSCSIAICCQFFYSRLCCYQYSMCIHPPVVELKNRNHKGSKGVAQ